jgi:hypothetical protein
MAPPYAKTVGALAVAAAAVVLLATKKHATESVPPPAETVAETIPAPPTEQLIPANLDAIESTMPHRSAEERAAVVKHTLTLAWGGERDRITERLVAQGLSRADAEQMGQRAIEGIADCVFDAARSQYEAQGDLKEFVDHVEVGWLEAALNLNRVRAAVRPCLANVAQQTGQPIETGWPADNSLGGSVDERITLPPPPPPWAAEMENRIRTHVASHPGLGVSDVVVRCREAGCDALLVGRDIRIFDFDFDVFAEQNGFQRAVVGGNTSSRSVWLER